MMQAVRQDYLPEEALQALPSSDVQRERVGRIELRREDVAVFDQGRTVVLAQALGPPRLWGYLLDTALDAFGDAFLRAEGSTPTRLNHGMRTASHYVRTRIDGLVAREGADVGLLSLSFDGPSLHLLGVGPFDAFLYRRKTMRVLGTREPNEGLFKHTAVPHVEHVEPGDMLFAASRSVCRAPLLKVLSSALEHDRALPAQELVEAIGNSARQHGVAAASVALRIPAVF